MADLCPKCGQLVTDGPICSNCGYSYEQNERTYQKALAMMQRCRTSLSFRGCAEVFDSISEHKDSIERAEECYLFAANLLKSQALIKKSYRQEKSIAKQRRQSGSLGRLK